MPVDFVLFALTLAGVALFHRHTLQVALIGLAPITLTARLHRLQGGPRAGRPGRTMLHEWVILPTCSACCSGHNTLLHLLGISLRIATQFIVPEHLTSMGALGSLFAVLDETVVPDYNIAVSKDSMPCGGRCPECPRAPFHFGGE